MPRNAVAYLSDILEACDAIQDVNKIEPLE